MQDGAQRSFMTKTKPNSRAVMLRVGLMVQALERLSSDTTLQLSSLRVTNGCLSRRGAKVAEFLTVEADGYTKACQNSYLNPHPVPPRTIAARRIAPAMDPIMILVPLGPAQRKEGGRVWRRKRRRRSRNKTTPLKRHIRGQDHHTSTTSTQRERERER